MSRRGDIVIIMSDGELDVFHLVRLANGLWISHLMIFLCFFSSLSSEVFGNCIWEWIANAAWFWVFIEWLTWNGIIRWWFDC